MRVIGGLFKGRKLTAPAGKDVRPTLDRVRETLFDIIQFDVAGSVFFDLFAGSGAIGIEALSRGASEVVFCDVNPKAVYKNLETVKAVSKVWECDFKKALNNYPAGYFDFIYVDPPFGTEHGLAALRLIGAKKLLKEGGKAVWEHLGAAPEVDGLKLIKSRKMLSFYGRDDE